jgi:hypothetical protein
MKTTIVILLFCLTALQAAAQTMVSNGQHLINRADNQLGKTSGLKIIVDRQSVDRSFDVNVEEKRIEFTAGDYVSFHGMMENKSSEVLQMNFYRHQVLPSDEWSSSVCFGIMCYMQSVDSLPPHSYYEFQPGEKSEFKVALTSAPNKTDSIVIYLKIAAMNTTEGDTIGFWLVGVAQGDQSVGASTANDARILSVYPSPMMTGSSIRASVRVPEYTGYSYSIFDINGREVAFGNSGHQLLPGENTIEIGELDGLASGSYLLRMKFGNTYGSDAVSFSVIR